jgi:hypothetical protein
MPRLGRSRPASNYLPVIRNEPVYQISFSLPVATVTISAFAFGLPVEVALTTATVNIAALTVTPSAGDTFALPNATVAIAAYPFTPVVQPVLADATVAIAARTFGFVHALTLRTATVSIAANPLLASGARNLIVAAAAAAGVDDYGNAFPQGLLANAGLIQGAEFVVTGGSGTGVFVYSPSPGAGNLIGSWSGMAGTDSYGNSYPAGLNVAVGGITGGDVILNNNGAFFYSGAPAAGNLIVSIAGTPGTDQFGNTYNAGLNWQLLASGGLLDADQVNAATMTTGTITANTISATSAITASGTITGNRFASPDGSYPVAYVTPAGSNPALNFGAAPASYTQSYTNAQATQFNALNGYINALIDVVNNVITALENAGITS